MKQHLAILLCLALSPMAEAQSLLVKKVKGKQAIVQLQDGATLKVGQTIPVGLDEFDEMSAMPSKSSRARLMGVSASFFTGKSDPGSNQTVLDVLFRYGWNGGKTEYGAIGILGMSDYGNGNTTSFGGGGFFDWNLNPNKAGNDMIYGGGVEASYKITNPPSGGTSSNTITLYPSGFLKWWILGSSTALRGDIGYSYAQINSGLKTTTSGIYAKAGFAVYF